MEPPQNPGGITRLPGGLAPMPSYCPRSSLPAKVLAWLADRLAHLHPPRPPGQGGTPPLSLEVRLDAVGRWCWTGCRTGAPAGRSGSCKTEVGDSLDLPLGPLGTLGFCQPDGTCITTLDDLRELLGEMARSGEAVCVDGLATRVQRPRSWANQKVVYDAKRHTHTAQGLAVSTIWGDLLWVDGGWPGSCHEHELLALAGLEGALDGVEVPSLLDRGFRGLAKPRAHWHAPVGDRRTIDRLSDAQRAYNRRQPPAGGAARAGGAVDRPAGRRLGAAPLAGAAAPGPGRLPGRRCADLPGPLAAPGSHMIKSITDTLARKSHGERSGGHLGRLRQRSQPDGRAHDAQDVPPPQVADGVGRLPPRELLP